MLTFLAYTLGCKLNLLESEAFTEVFLQAGFSLYNKNLSSYPSVILINTCTVTSKADQKARRVIRKALRDFPDSLILVTGCYAKLNQSEIINLGENQNDSFFVLQGLTKENILCLPHYLDTGSVSNSLKTWYEDLLKEKNEQHPNNEEKKVFQFSPKQFSGHTRSFLKIQDGCDNHCTYCKIRLARGSSISLDSNQVLARLKILETQYAETVLTGVNISQYSGRMSGDKSHNASCGSLGELLEFLLAGTSKIALRLSSLAPDRIDDSFAKVLTDKRIRPHFHLSLQSGSKKILEKMGRNYDAGIIEKSVNLLRSVKDDPFLACDIITGFPGESEMDFIETLDLCRRIGFAWIHVFPFSKRQGTPAWSFSDTVNDKEINRRVQLLTDLAWSGRADYITRWLGKEVDVLIEKKNLDKLSYHGISENYLKLLIFCNGENVPLRGDVIRCRLGQEKINEKKDYDAIAFTDK